MPMTLEELREALMNADLPSKELRGYLLKFKKRGEMADLSKKSGITKATISRLRKGSYSHVKYSTWEKLARASPRIIDPLINLMNMSILSEDESLLLKNYRKLDKARRDSMVFSSNMLLLDMIEENEK